MHMQADQSTNVADDRNLTGRQTADDGANSGRYSDYGKRRKLEGCLVTHVTVGEGWDWLEIGRWRLVVG
ncbi:hypothetical protein FNV43_RR12414 [Rhamnella rubrinervis]|uniref:Uncharacterized protein n=1 Tax=Rhamnella rubrinervis TaxID=2594499 RepID=A0A8K0H7U4_9ROSA|nr:hypothetical protein FNV43_RR12414 [Rhamnella rubrinervis]